MIPARFANPPLVASTQSTNKLGTKSLSEKGSDPLEAIRFHWFFLLTGEGQTPFRTGSKWGLGRPCLNFIHVHVFREVVLRSPLETACEAARLGGKILLDYLGKAEVREKGPADLVTDADLASQRAIEQLIRLRYPQHEFLGEESSVEDRERAVASGRPLWVVDPLDGTANFVHRLPSFSVSVALVEQNEASHGAVYDPLSDTLYAASKMGAVTKNGKPIRVSPCQRLDQAMVCCSFRPSVQRSDPEVAQFLCVLERSQSLRRLGSAALNLCYVAEGCLDAYWASSVKTWDVAAGYLIARAAGATLTKTNGGTFDLWEPQLLITATEPLHAEMLECLRMAGR